MAYGSLAALQCLAIALESFEFVELKPMEKRSVELQICEVMHISLIFSYIRWTVEKQTAGSTKFWVSCRAKQKLPSEIKTQKLRIAHHLGSGLPCPFGPCSDTIKFFILGLSPASWQWPKILRWPVDLGLQWASLMSGVRVLSVLICSYHLISLATLMFLSAISETTTVPKSLWFFVSRRPPTRFGASGVT